MSCAGVDIHTHTLRRQQQPQMLQKLAAAPPVKMEALAWKNCRLLAEKKEKNFKYKFFATFHSPPLHVGKKQKAPLHSLLQRRHRGCKNTANICCVCMEMNNSSGFRMRTSHKTLYLTFILSTVCIFLYQYHMSIPRIVSLQQQSINEVRPSRIN